MKKTVFLLIAALSAAAGFASERNDRPITLEELPNVSQQFIEMHFADVGITYVTIDEEWFDKDYKVLLDNGMKIEFGKNGEWTEIDGNRRQLPAGVVPQQIREQIGSRFPDRKIVAIDRDHHDYEVELDNGLDLTFDRQFRLIEIDD